jgi:hypothetical protein
VTTVCQQHNDLLNEQDEIAAEATNFASLTVDEIQLPWTHFMFSHVEVTSFIT